MKKTFVITMLGQPFDWIQQYIDHVQHLAAYGWEWIIITPSPLESKGNVKIVNLTAEQLADLIEQKLGVKPNLYITEKGVPSIHVTDLYVFSGVIFEDYLKDSDFWGITNLDVVYGRLDHFVNDAVLSDCDIFTDDVNIINGVFCLFRNNPLINRLFDHFDWKKVLTQPVCPKCTTGQGIHTLFGSDEYLMTEVLKRVKGIRYKYPSYYPMHSYDRLAHHRPPNLEMSKDRALCEIFEDPLMQSMPTNPLFKLGHFGREIAYFHFLTTKKWPNIKTR